MFPRDMTLSDAERLTTRAGESDAALQMDEDAFRAFYDRTSRALWLYLVRLSGDRHVADDLFQDTYYRFLRAGATHESDAHRRNALFHIATNLVRDARRRDVVRRLHSSGTPDETAAIADPTDEPARAQGRADLSRAMARLSTRERALVWLAYAQGATHREIAERVGVETGSVKLLLFRARRKLARFLTGERKVRR